MASQRSAEDVLTTIARSLVVAEVYPTVEDALQGLALAEVRRRVNRYRRRIRRLERKHNADYASFSSRLLGRATPDEEDDWLAWRSALGLLEDWEGIYKELRSARPGS